MSDTDQELIWTIDKISADIRALDTDDKEAIINCGAALEQVMSQAPQDMTDVSRLLGLCLEALQAIYSSEVEDPKALACIMADGLSAAVQHLSSGDTSAESLDAAVSALSEALGHDMSKSSPTPRPRHSLDDVAALLIQLEPTDIEDLSRLCDALTALAAYYPGNTAVSQAAQQVDMIVKGEAEDPKAVMSEAGKLIEQALDVLDEPAASQVPKPREEQVEEKSTKTSAKSARQTNARVKDVEPAITAVQSPEPDQIEAEQTYLPADADPGLLGEFIVECREYIEGAEAALLSLETDSEDAEAVNTVFRAFHTIKGTSAFLGLNHLSELAHKAESLLSRVRDHEITCTGGYADLALRSIDMLKELIQSVQDALGGQPMVKPQGLDELMTLLANPEAHGISSDGGELSAPRVGDLLVAEGKASREEVEMVAASQGEQPLGSALVKADAASVSDVAKALRTQKKLASGEQAVESSVRVRTDRLDRLIDTVGEMVIAHSMVAQDDIVVLGSHHELNKKVTHLGKIVRELQYLSMSMRMVPLKATFQKMARLVRDVAKKSGKLVEFVTDGEDTEIDRNMVDIINDPLVHMVRNAVDHGIEMPDIRSDNGKDRTGRVWLRAYHSGGNVVVEMQDDGKGLDREKIVEKAISKGLIDTDKGMTDSEVLSLIFEPGFSTVDKVTDLSGRGVGMDVVKKSVEALMGRIDISSEKGKGTVFSIRLPLTLAVTDGMLVQVGPERFIIPTVSIHISFRPERDSLSTVNSRGELVMLRGELMPICRLHRLFGIDGAIEDPNKGLLVVVGDGDRRCAILVDELLGQQHVVAKSLGEGVGKIQGISGGAILGDGRVGLILDTAEIEALAKQVPSGASWVDLALKVA